MKHFSIIVTYEPNVQRLEMLCNSLIRQLSTVLIVDNSEYVSISNNQFEGCTILRNGENIGIAAAQNIGIEYAITEGADILTFFDQDSQITDDLIQELLIPFKKISNCVTAPVPINKGTGKEYPSHTINWLGWPKDIFSNGKVIPYQTDLVISSGLTVPKSVIQNIGRFDEDFFIDFVDIEWCLRCKRNKISIFIIPTAKMSHSIGDNDIIVGKIVCTRHSPQRTYYKVRNSFLILRKKAPFLFFLMQSTSAIFKNYLIMKNSENSELYFRYYKMGIRDGICGKRGKCSLNEK